MNPRRALVWTALSLLAAGGACPVAFAFASVAVGDTIENVELPTAGGGKHALLSPGALANVFVFFRPQQEHSLEALKALAACEKEFAGKRVHWVAVVSSSWSAADVDEVVRESGIRMPVLVDVGDALYGRLGVRLHPAVGIANDRLQLVAYEPYHRINYCDRIRGKIRYAMREIGLAEVEQIDNPARALFPNEIKGAVANRHVRMGEIYLGMGQYEKAAAEARHVLEEDPQHASANVLLGDALAAQGRCAEATAPYAAARKLDVKLAAAVQQKEKACASRR